MFNEMRVATRLALAFIAVTILLIAGFLLGISRMAQIDEKLTEITDTNDVEIKFGNDISTEASEIGIYLRNIVLLTDDAGMKVQTDKLHETIPALEASFSAIAKLFEADAGTTQAEKDLLSKMRQQWQEVQTTLDPVLTLGLANKNEEATRLLMKTFVPKNQALRETIQT